MVRNSIVRREVVVEEDVKLDDCIIMDYVHLKRGARLRRTIIGRYNSIAAGTRLGYDPEADGRSYHVTPSGIVMIPPGETRDTMRAFSENDY